MIKLGLKREIYASSHWIGRQKRVVYIQSHWIGLFSHLLTGLKLPFSLLKIFCRLVSPEVIVALLGQLNLSAGKTKVLDLGCGKGAISILIAQKLGFQVLGVDICDPYLDFARDKAKAYMVSLL